jgi:endo-1,4-beta-mannosidase
VSTHFLIKHNLLQAWIDKTAAHIHGLDKNHLVTVGTEGFFGSSSPGAYLQKSHSLQYKDGIQVSAHATKVSIIFVDGLRLALFLLHKTNQF